MEQQLTPVSVGGRDFLIGRLDLFTSFQLSRKLGPLLIPVIPLITRLYGAAKEMSFAAVMRELQVYLPDALSIFAEMPDEHADWILRTCLSAVSVKQATGVARVFANGQLMFQDLKLPDLFQLAFEVIKANLGDFMPTGPLKESAAGEAAPS